MNNAFTTRHNIIFFLYTVCSFIFLLSSFLFYFDLLISTSIRVKVSKFKFNAQSKSPV
jgi:hypothetical protein